MMKFQCWNVTILFKVKVQYFERNQLYHIWKESMKKSVIAIKTLVQTRGKRKARLYDEAERCNSQLNCYRNVRGYSRFFEVAVNSRRSLLSAPFRSISRARHCAASRRSADARRRPMSGALIKLWLRFAARHSRPGVPIPPCAYSRPIDVTL